jgi:Fe-S oxidoreductase
VQPTRQEFLHISSAEKVLFYVLTFASLAYMAWQVWQRVKLWRQGKPVEWSQAREGWRYWVPTREAFRGWAGNVGKYILGQKKVRTSRKKSGAPMHLLIFYGFLSLFVATTLLAIATYGPYNFHRGNYYLVYEMTFDILGLLFVVGIGWAFFRRLRLTAEGNRIVAATAAKEDPIYAGQLVQNRRAPLSSAPSDFWTLGLLFLLGVNGYWLEAARISVNPQPFDWASPVGYAWAQLQGPITPEMYKFVWWFHIIGVLVFFAVLPKMRIKHVLMAIFTAAGKPEQPMGELKPISMEEVEQTEQIGVKLPKDYSRWHLMSLDACMECGRCTEVCPAWNVGKVLNPKQVVQDIRGALATGEEVAPRVTEEALWQCTTCNACVEACPVLIRHVDLIVDVRRNLVSEGQLSGSAATMLRQTASTSNAWGAPASQREDWMKGLDIPLCRDGVEFDYLFWVGCAGATDPGAVKTTKAVADLLKKAGVKFACLGKEEACTGDPARRVGEEFLYQDKAAQNISVFERYGVKKVVTHCPHCFNTFKNEYGQFGGQLEVVHHTQLLQQLVSKGDLVAAKPNRGEVVFHDPCYLGRVNEESEAPRTLVENLVDPPHHGRKTLCCGAGGGRMWMEEPADQRPSNRRAEELVATGAKTVALGCPFCKIMLDSSIKQVTQDEIRLVDLAEMLQEANANPPV